MGDIRGGGGGGGGGVGRQGGGGQFESRTEQYHNS